MDIQEIHQLFLKCSAVSIDTRKIEKGCLFVAIKGERFDANTFAEEALDKGASYVIIDNEKYYKDERTIVVDDSLHTLQSLSKFHRNFLGIPIIALTGSNGKTTTKELIHVVLSQKFNTKATIGNLNNHIGVPLTLLRFDTKTEIGIVEMGANHQKEIEFLCDIAAPDYGYITNFGKAHLEGFGGVEGVIKGKSEMYAYLLASRNKIFVNLDDPIQVQKTSTANRITFGLNHKEADTCVDHVSANPFVEVDLYGYHIQSQLIGLYNANNINAAIAIGRYFKVDMEAIKKAIESYLPENNRSQLVKKNSNEIILDAYNANPSSMSLAIANFLQLEREHKMIILGDMFELGTESSQEHRSIIESLSKTVDIDCYFIGKDFYKNRKEQSNFYFFETFELFAEQLQKNTPRNRMILIKGSRGMALERTLEYL